MNYRSGLGALAMASTSSLGAMSKRRVFGAFVVVLLSIAAPAFAQELRVYSCDGNTECFEMLESMQEDTYSSERFATNFEVLVRGVNFADWPLADIVLGSDGTMTGTLSHRNNDDTGVEFRSVGQVISTKSGYLDPSGGVNYRQDFLEGGPSAFRTSSENLQAGDQGYPCDISQPECYCMLSPELCPGVDPFGPFGNPFGDPFERCGGDLDCLCSSIPIPGVCPGYEIIIS
jgi:hypothetical protein